MAIKVKANTVIPNNDEVVIVDISEMMRIAIWRRPVGWSYDEIWLHKIFVVSWAVAVIQTKRLISHAINKIKSVVIGIYPP